ncbi:ExbD/TolR family protein [Tundrisphaera lichenicola]|uniref:ExbD/TolR family protein n=1 Tax=Tundrisphaera lichenicola TaxID=2029860 RepID=UPI003EC0ACDA
MSSSTSNELRAEPNLTPLLDVVFQLITFFMLVINFSQDNFDSRIRLPIAGSARPQDDAGKLAEERLVLNVDGQGNLLFNGQTLTADEATQKIKLEAQIARSNIKALRGKVEVGAALPARVVIRADRDTPFSALFGLISTCQSNGYQKFDLKAMNGP